MEYHADVAVIIALCASSRKKICLKTERENKMTDIIDKKELELHTSAPSVELANDAARNARCKECNHIRVVYMNAPGLPMRYACKELGFRLCVDICDEVCPKSGKEAKE